MISQRTVAFSLVLLCLSGGYLEASEKPNIIVILADDLGAVDLNCYGSRDLSTPNIDQLAKEGLRFSQFYVVAPICSPSRGALLTGRYPDHNGVTKNSSNFHADETTIAEMLKPMGYQSALIGKWHLGMKHGGPNGEGFDYFYGHRGGCIENWGHNTLDWDTGRITAHDLWQNKTPVHREGKHFGEMIAEESIKFIRNNKENPFFLYVSFNNPHYPVQPLKHHFDRYSNLEEPRRSYAAFVSTMDEQTGSIIKAVNAMGLRKKTVIIFLSDHGHSPEKRNMLFIKDANENKPYGGSSGIYRGEKFQVFEGGVRVPFIISQPGTLPQGETREQLAASIDILPTTAEIVGAPLPPKPLDGVPMNAILASKNAESTHSIIRYVTAGKNHWGIREGKWKLVHLGVFHLMDLINDPGEQNNLATQHPEVVERLVELNERERSKGCYGAGSEQ